MFTLIKNIFKKTQVVVHKVVETKQEARKRRKEEKRQAEWSAYMGMIHDNEDMDYMDFGEAFNFHHDCGDR